MDGPTLWKPTISFKRSKVLCVVDLQFLLAQRSSTCVDGRIRQTHNVYRLIIFLHISGTHNGVHREASSCLIPHPAEAHNVYQGFFVSCVCWP